ncbi:MAG TPA: hypothetical protein VHH88_07315, partial [Verrucomicrobiae bacterium]|nr:hypothetical protein [Verrucomicrobiae bacterium]
MTNTRLSGDTTNGFSVLRPDGSQDVYGLVVTNGGGAFLEAFLTESWNAHSQKTSFYYEPYSPANPVIRLSYVVDGDGGTNMISYVTSNAYSTNLISQIVDPFGHTSQFRYDEGGFLTNVTDVAGISSSFVYNARGWPSTLITPYGTTTFAFTDALASKSPNGRSVLVT